MATFAEMMAQAAIQSSAPENFNNTTQAFASGAQLAMKQEELNQNKMQLEQKKQQMEEAKWDKVGGWFDTASKMPDGAAKKAYVDHFIPNGIQALNMQDRFDPVAMKMLQGDTMLGKFLNEQVRNGKMTFGDIQAATKDADILAKLIPEKERWQSLQNFQNTVGAYTGELDDASKLRTQEIGKSDRAEQVANAALGKQIQAQNETGNVELRKKVSDSYNAYVNEGGASGVVKNISALDKTIKQLKNNEVILGTIGKTIPYGSTEDVLARTDPKAKALVDSVRGSVNMRAALADPNPTEKQINQILGRTIDPRLSNQANIDKLEAAKAEMLNKTHIATEEFRRHGLIAPEAPPQKPAKTYKIGTETFTEQEAKMFYKAHPRFKPPAGLKVD